MFEKLKKIHQESVEALGKRERNTQPFNLDSIPLGGSKQDLIVYASKQREDYQARIKDLEFQQKITETCRTVVDLYGEFSNQLKNFTEKPEVTAQDEKDLGESYDRLNKALDTIRKDPAILNFFLEAGLGELFPEKQDEGAKNEELKPSIKEILDGIHEIAVYRLIMDDFRNLKKGETLSRDQLIEKYYKDVEPVLARDRLKFQIRTARTEFGQEGLSIVNSTSASERAKGRCAVYVLVAMDPARSAKLESKSKNNIPVHDTRLDALGYIFSKPQSADINIDEIKKMLGPSRGRKRVFEKLTNWQSIHALNNGFNKLVQRAKAGNTLTDNEKRVLELYEGFHNSFEEGIKDFREQILLPLFGYKSIDRTGLKTDESKEEFLSKPVVDGCPFTNRDAIYLAHALYYYKNAIEFYFRECDLPDEEMVNNLVGIFGKVVFRDDCEESKVVREKDQVTINCRTEAIKHFKEWVDQDERFEDGFNDIEPEEISEIIFALFSLNLKKKVEINGEEYGGLEFLAKLSEDNGFKALVARDMEKRRI